MKLHKKVRWGLANACPEKDGYTLRMIGNWAAEVALHDRHVCVLAYDRTLHRWARTFNFIPMPGDTTRYKYPTAMEAMSDRGYVEVQDHEDPHPRR